MQPTNIYIHQEEILTLIKSCRCKNGNFAYFKRYCIKDPKKFFQKKNLDFEYDNLLTEEKEIFNSDRNFFDALVKFNFKNSESISCKNILPICKVCEKETDFLNIKEGYENCCSKECTQKLRKNVYFQKTGYENPSQNPEVKHKKEQTCLIKTGYKHPSQVPAIKKQKEISYFQKTGYKNPSQNPNVKDKRKETIVKKFGVENAFQSEKIKTKIKEKIVKKFGVEHQLQSEEIKNKIKETNKEKYGVENNKQKHIKNYEKLNDIDFIITNFTKNNHINFREIQEFFNTTSSKYLLDVISKLEKRGYCIPKKHYKSENDFICLLEKMLDTSLNRQYRIEGTRYKVDAYDPETNTIYEFLGDYWHGNPEVYDSEDINTNNGKTFKELYDDTFERLYEIKTLGYDVKYIWESDWKEKKLDGIKSLN